MKWWCSLRLPWHHSPSAVPPPVTTTTNHPPYIPALWTYARTYCCTCTYILTNGRYNDGLDKWRLTATEVRNEFAKKGADVVYAFQTRNPTHAGHAYLMRTAGDKLREQVRGLFVARCFQRLVSFFCFYFASPTWKNRLSFDAVVGYPFRGHPSRC